MKKIKLSGILMLLLLLLLIAYYIILGRDKLRQNQQPVIGITQTDTIRSNKPTAHGFLTDTNVSAAYLTGKFNATKDPEFDRVDTEFSNRSDLYLLKDTYKAFIKMYYAAQMDGITLTIVSATRSFTYQKNIWEQKWNGIRLVDGKNLASAVKNPVDRAKIILTYSAMPGTSRHHWGTDIDVNSVDTSYFETAQGKKVFNWLSGNAYKYGFCQPYKASDKPANCYSEEKWHWSYVPLSKIFLRAYKKKVGYADISGFLGCETAAQLDVINNCVMEVNPDCE